MPSKAKQKSAGPKTTGTSTEVVPLSVNSKQEARSISTSDIANATIQRSSAPSSEESLQAVHGVDTGNAAGINKKKQKRRAKEAARRAVTQPTATTSHYLGSERQRSPQTNGYVHGMSDHEETGQYHHRGDDDRYLTDDASTGQITSKQTASVQVNGYSDHSHSNPISISKRKKNTRGSMSEIGRSFRDGASQPSGYSMQRPSPPSVPSRSGQITQHARNNQKDRIWNTSTAEERERIKEFWLSLGEEDRRGLVRIEKEAVLKKMKEQQKHSCSCTVCGRKRTAIEEELEVLYDAYYEELETYANHQQFGMDASTMPPPRAFPRSRSLISPTQYGRSSLENASMEGNRDVAEDEDYREEEDYSDADEDDGLSEDDVDRPMSPAGSIFNFGNSLTAKGGILTVADDLLKNDGKKFIDMMEQLAERRMQREEEAHMVASGIGHPSMRHGPVEEEGDERYDDDEEEEDDDYNSEEEEDAEDDEMDMTEEQRMEEGRRMFQIFAARMFEQRVLTAYREKVSSERQAKLIEEMQEDEQLDAQRQAKKAKEAQKKREKRQKQKQMKDEEKAKREAEKAAEEAAARHLEAQKAEEQRLKKEEQRKKREAEKSAIEEAKRRKEEEKQRQAQERKAQQAEQERKLRDQKELEKRKREESKRNGRAEQEAQEKATLNAKSREAVPSKTSEIMAHTGSSARVSEKLHYPVEKSTFGSSSVRAPSQPAANPVMAATSLVVQQPLSSHASPRLAVATPVLPKTSAAARPRQRSQQESGPTSPKSIPVVPVISNQITAFDRSTKVGVLHSRRISQSGPSQILQNHPQISTNDNVNAHLHHPPGFTNYTPVSHTGPHNAGMAHNALTSQQMHHQSADLAAMSSSVHTQPRHLPEVSLASPPGIAPSGLNHAPLTNSNSLSRQIPSDLSQVHTTGSHMGRYGAVHDPVPAQTHSRNPSASSAISPREGDTRPAPIKRPSSTKPHQRPENFNSISNDVDDLSNHLGSSALIDDTDEAPEPSYRDGRINSIPIGGSRPLRQGFGQTTTLAPIGSNVRSENNPPYINNDMWSHKHQAPFGSQQHAPQSFVSPPGFGRGPNGPPFGGAVRPAARGLRIRNLVCATCHNMSAFGPSQGYHPADQVLREVQAMMLPNEGAVGMTEMLQLCDTEGNAQNGGGWFECKGHDKIGFLIKHHADTNGSLGHRGGPLGDIGSPIAPPNRNNQRIPSSGGLQTFQQPGSFLPPPAY